MFVCLLVCLLLLGRPCLLALPAFLLACFLVCFPAFLPACLLACLLACLRARLLACLLACLPACLLALGVCLLAYLHACFLACLPACVLAGLLACLLACFLYDLLTCFPWRLRGQLKGQLAGWLAGWLLGWLAGWLAGWLPDWLPGCLWLAAWLAALMPGGGFFFLWRPPWLAWLVGVWSVQAWSFVRAFGVVRVSRLSRLSGASFLKVSGPGQVSGLGNPLAGAGTSGQSILSGCPGMTRRPSGFTSVRANGIVHLSGRWGCPVQKMLSGRRNLSGLAKGLRGLTRGTNAWTIFLRGLPATRSLLRGRALSGRLRMDTWKCLDT